MERMYLLLCLGNEGNDLDTSINDSTRHEYKEKEPTTKVANHEVNDRN